MGGWTGGSNREVGLGGQIGRSDWGSDWGVGQGSRMGRTGRGGSDEVAGKFFP